MHRKYWLCGIVLLFSLITLSATAQEMMSPACATSDPPRPPDYISFPPHTTTVSPTTLDLAPLKAVLLVGPIDGNDGSWTLEEIANMELAADELEAHGVTVYRFYPGGSVWDQIKDAAEGAHFLLYRGHGLYDGNLPHPNVGGFDLSSGCYSSDDIRQDLHLAPSAIVMLYGCFTAGSSSAPGDTHDIGITEASRRVAQYSDPFFDIGAAGYYANWFGDAFQQFLANLFAGQTLGDAYENYFDFNSDTVYRTTHPDHPSMAMWVDKDHWGYWKYNNAFAGQPDQTLEDLFPPAELSGIPTSLVFTATVEGSVQIAPASYTVTPQNSGNDADLDWTLSTAGEWFTVSPGSGATPETFTITPQTFDTSRPGVYTGAVTVTSPSETKNPVQRIDLTLRVFAPALGGLPSAFHFVYSTVDEEFLQPNYEVTPQNVGSDATLTWEIATDSPWLALSTDSGATPQTFTITTTGFDTTTVAAYSGVLTVTVTDPIQTYQSPQVLPVTLRVIDWPFSNVHLPLIARSSEMSSDREKAPAR
jgi:hypothetical protein